MRDVSNILQVEMVVVESWGCGEVLGAGKCRVWGGAGCIQIHSVL